MIANPHDPHGQDDDDVGTFTGHDHDIGYCKPPKATRFKKGVSGNPSGTSRERRARKSQRAVQPVLDMIIDEMMRPVTINDNGVRTEIETQRAIMRGAAVRAMKGSPQAQKFLLGLMRDAQDSQRVEKDSRFGYMVRYAIEQKDLEAYPLPGRQSSWPRWQDVHLDYRLGIGEVVGPIDENQAEQCEALLDAYLLCASRRAVLANLAASASEVYAMLVQETIALIDRLRDMMAAQLPLSYLARIAELIAPPLNEALIIEHEGRPLDLADLVLEDLASTPDMLATLLSTLGDELTAHAQQAMKRAKLSVHDNTESLVHRLRQEEQDRSDGRATPRSVQSLDNFYPQLQAAAAAKGIV